MGHPVLNPGTGKWWECSSLSLPLSSASDEDDLTSFGLLFLLLIGRPPNKQWRASRCQHSSSPSGLHSVSCPTACWLDLSIDITGNRASIQYSPENCPKNCPQNPPEKPFKKLYKKIQKFEVQTCLKSSGHFSGQFFGTELNRGPASVRPSVPFNPQLGSRWAEVTDVSIRWYTSTPRL